MFKVTYADPFLIDITRSYDFESGSKSILEFVEDKCNLEREDVIVVYKCNDDVLFFVEQKYWKGIRPKEGEYMVYAKPKDKNTLRGVLTVALVAAGTVATGGWGAGIAGAFGATSAAAGTFATAVVSAGVTMAATYLAQQIIPIDVPDQASASPKESSTLNITGSNNTVKAGAPIPYVIGTTKVVPPLAINPIREAQGQDVWLTQVFCFGYGPLDGLTEDNIRLGTQPLRSFTDYEIQIQDQKDTAYSLRREDPDGWTGDIVNKITMVQGDIQDSPQNVLIKETEDPRIFTTAANTEEIGVELTFNGLVRFDDAGRRQDRQVSVALEYRKQGTSDWIGFDGNTEGTSCEVITDTYYRSFDNGYNRIGVRRRKSYKCNDCFIVLPSGYNIAVGQDVRIMSNGTGNTVDVKAVYSSIGLESTLSGGIYGRTLTGTILKIGGWNEFTFSPGKRKPKSYGVCLPSNNTDAYLNEFANPINIVDNTAEPLFATYKVTDLPKGIYEVRVSRLTPDTNDTKIRDEFSVTNIRSIQRTDDNGREIVVFPPEFCYVALKIKASDQLNGSIQNLSGVVSSVVERYSEEDNDFVQDPNASGNNAWEFLKLLTGSANKRFINANGSALPDGTGESWEDIIDIDAFLDWAAVCDQPVLSRDGVTLEPRYRYNTVVDYETTVGELARKIASVGRASISMADGKYSIIYDAPNKPAVSRLTPANTFGFSASKSFARIPDAFRCKFVNKDKSYNVDEVIIKRDDNVILNNDSLIQDINCDGITDPDQVYRYAKYALAQMILRPEEYRVSTGIEHKYFRRGDVISMTHDKIQGVLHYSRVKSISGNDVELDQAFQLEAVSKITFRYAGTDVQDLSVYDIIVKNGSILTLSSVPDELQVGDLAIAGANAESITQKYIVKSKTPADDDTCEVALVDYADPAIFDAENGIIQDYDPGLIDLTIVRYSEPPRPIAISVVTDEKALLVGQDGSLITRAGFILDKIKKGVSDVKMDTVNFTLDTVSGFTFDSDGVQIGADPVFIEAQWRIVESDGSYKKQTFDFTNDYIYIGGLQDTHSYDFRFRFISEFGIFGEWIYIDNLKIIGKSTPPSDVTGFNYIENREGILFSWNPNTELDVKEYEIREGSNWDSAVKIDRLKANQKLIDSRTVGTYNFLIKAIDVVNNYSVNAVPLSVQTFRPSAVTGFSYTQVKDGIIFEWNANTDIDIAEYEIREGSNWDSAVKIDRLKANRKKIETREAGSYTYLIKAIDLVGDYSEQDTSLIVVIDNPGSPSGMNFETIDNNVQLRWSAPSSGFQIEYYNVYRESTEFLGGIQEIGYSKTTFFNRFEINAGLYTYYIEPVDIAGNVGERSSIQVELDVPPDFVLISDLFAELGDGTAANGAFFQDADLTFDNTEITFDSIRSFTFDYSVRTNVQFCLDVNKKYSDFIAEQSLFGQFDSSNDFTFDSDTALTFDAGLSVNNLIGQGYTYWNQKAATNSGHYEIIIDYGREIEASKVTVNDSWNVLSPSLNKSYILSQSLDGINYINYSSKVQFMRNFRYVKFRIDLTASTSGFKPMETLQAIRFKLDLKRKYDGGNGSVTDAINGKVVAFNTGFLDVDSITVTAKGNVPLIPIYDFDNDGDQLDFTVYIFDLNGNKVTGDFSWSAEGF